MKKTTETTYFYKEAENSDDVILERTVVSETTEGYDCSDCEDGELLTSEVEVVDEGVTLATAALALATVSLCIAAIGSIFRRN